MKPEYLITQDRVHIFTGLTPASQAESGSGLLVVSPGYAQNHTTRSMRALVKTLSGISDVLILDYWGPKTWDVFERGLHAERMFLQDPGKFIRWISLDRKTSCANPD